MISPLSCDLITGSASYIYGYYNTLSQKMVRIAVQKAKIEYPSRPTPSSRRRAERAWGCHPLFVVIPAQAGIHFFTSFWIPNCAGMTSFTSTMKKAHPGGSLIPIVFYRDGAGSFITKHALVLPKTLMSMQEFCAVYQCPGEVLKAFASLNRVGPAIFGGDFQFRVRGKT